MPMEALQMWWGKLSGEYQKWWIQYTPLVEKVKKYWWVAVLIVFGVAVGVVLAIPQSRAFAYEKVTAFHRAFSGTDPSAAASGEVDPAMAQVQQLTEQVNQLQDQLNSYAQQYVADQKSLADVQSQFQTATSDVAAATATFQKQQQQWEQSLKQLGVTVTSDSNVFATPRPTTSSTSETQSTESPVVASGKINLNRASLAELENLPGIGPAYAQRIIDYRNQKGAFKKIEDVMNIKGLKDALFAKIKDKIEV